MSHAHPIELLPERIADRLADPDAVPRQLTDRPWWRQSLAHGAPGIALLHIERAAAGLAPWQPAHAWLAHATHAPLTAGADSHLFYGAPALGHALACAAAHRPDRYGRALDTLDQAIAKDTHRRLDDAHARMDRCHLPALAEFDVIRGLAGLGRYLLHHDPKSQAIRHVLEYLVRLTNPVAVGGEILPGWWTMSSPTGRPSDDFLHGHANNGMAHGIAGPLALLALAARQGVTVTGQRTAITTILAWLDRWRVTTSTGPAWPYWITRPHLRAGQRDVPDTQRPSWCYGTAGLARAQQLAGVALADATRCERAERALLGAMSSPAQRSGMSDASLCHGYAGLAHLATVVAADASPTLAERLRAIVPGLLDAVALGQHDAVTSAATLASSDPGLLEGASGTALAILGATTWTPSRTGWDTCLLIA
ncbi:MAG TPA: lanthionine synthetase C family protein [Acidimicrobiales bacterium]|jgi:hypothetical protein